MYSSMGNPGGNAGSGASQDQPALPAWLESLRSGMGDTADASFTSENQSDNYFGDRNPNNQPYTSGQWDNNTNKSGNLQNQPAQQSAPMSLHVADLIDANSLPSWLRSAGEAEQTTPAPTNEPETPKPQSSLRPASYKAPDTDENYFTRRENNSRDIAAHSLVDEQSLPPWMQQDQPSAPQENQRNISASSLIQPDSMPDWMKNMQTPTTPSAPPSSPRRGDIHDAQQTPSQAIPTTGQGFAARDLIDQQSLPPWMKQQAGQDQQAGQSVPFSASSLVDKNMMPAWMREENQRQQPTSAPRPPSAYTQSPQPQQAQTPSNAQHSIPASSFIDMNALPPWLRQHEESQLAQNPMQQGSGYNTQNGQAGPQRPTYPVPPRAENMRVPTRPRTDMAPNEGNEVAANVFASMLGVASTTPNFPLSAPQGYPGTQAPQAPQGVQGGQGPSSGTLPPQGPGNMPPQQPAYMPTGYPAMNTGSNQHQGSYPMGNYPAGNYPTGNPPLMPPNMSGQQPGMQNFGPNQYAQNMGNPTMPNEQQTNAKPAKRGLFEAIRSWLFRS